MPNSPFTTALARHQANDLAEATRLYKEILAADPHHPDALHMLGVIARQRGNNDLALKLIEASLSRRMETPLAWYNRSLILRLMGRNDDALQSAEQAVACDPGMADAWDAAGFLLREKKQFDRSRDCHARAVALQPDNLKFLANYAMLLFATGDLKQSYAILQKVEKRDPDMLLHTMGNVLLASGYPERAVPYFRKSRSLVPGNKELLVSEALARLLMGDFKEGWALWEQRPNLNARFEHIPFWQGKKIDHLLLHEDQGLGDTIQCARYIPQLQPYTSRITFQGPHFLIKLLQTSYPDIHYVPDEDPVPAADARIRLLSLPAFFNADGTNIPNKIPYIKIRDEWRQSWRERLAHIPKPRIGIVWGGNPNHTNDRQRSIPFAQFAPLLRNHQAHIVSLQKGGHRNTVDLAAAGIYDAEPMLGDFTDTAGLMAELDLLISVDTATVHLAGSIGLPTWLLVPFEPDWRWLLEREDSPWYPTLRIFRQHEPRNWPPVIARATADLHRMMSGDTSVLRPTPWQSENPRQNSRALILKDSP